MAFQALTYRRLPLNKISKFKKCLWPKLFCMFLVRAQLSQHNLFQSFPAFLRHGDIDYSRTSINLRGL